MFSSVVESYMIGTVTIRLFNLVFPCYIFRCLLFLLFPLIFFSSFNLLTFYTSNCLLLRSSSSRVNSYFSLLRFYIFCNFFPIILYSYRYLLIRYFYLCLMYSAFSFFLLSCFSCMTFSYSSRILSTL